MSGDWEEMLREAQERLAAMEGGGGNADLGEAMTPEPEDHFAGRWRGVGQMQTRHGERDVYLVWRAGDDAPGFLYQHARLVVEVDLERPDVGDEVLILRGPTEYFEKAGEQRTVFPYVLRKRPCSDPPPADEPVPVAPTSPAGESRLDDDIPFMPTV